MSRLPVLLPRRAAPCYEGCAGFCRWLASAPAGAVFAAALAAAALLAFSAAAQGGGNNANVFATLWRWLPFLLKGFAFTVLISFLTMAVGTASGMLLGIGQLSHNRAVAAACWFVTQVFRNSPWLVLLFIVMLTLPFEIRISEDNVISVPDWVKAVFGLALPIMANISEVVRGAINSVPTGQWEASESLAFTRRQTFYQIIIPQCFKRMIPPWMNWYAILTMATPIVSILGVEEVLNLSRQAIEAENNRPELLVPFYGFVLLIFFAYCYPIARLTIRLERRFAVKL